MAKPTKKVTSRIVAGVRKYQKIFSAANDRDINESDTVVVITDFLSEVLGYDKYLEVTTEFCIRGTYCDLAVKVDGQVKFLIEVKAIGVTLRQNHLRQAVSYAAQQGIEWVVLTNGRVWNVYKLKFEKPIDHDLVFSIDLLDADPRDGAVVDRLFTLSREGLAKSAIEQFQEQVAALNPVLVGAVVRSDPVLAVVRRELRRITPKAKIDLDDLRQILREDVIKRDVVEGDEAKTAKGRVKRAASRTLKRKKVAKTEAKKMVSGGADDAPLQAG